MRKKYSTDLPECEEIKPLLVGMRNRKWSKRDLIVAVFYLVDSGCKWRQLPHDFPPVFTVHSFYRRAKLSGLWNKILEHMVKMTRKNAGLEENLTVALVDSQSVQNAYASEQAGYDAGKGIKRQIATDTFIVQIKEYLGLEVEISQKITPHGWQVISPRWVVERTFAWLNNSCRLNKNYEYSMLSAEIMVKISHLHTLLKRL